MLKDKQIKNTEKEKLFKYFVQEKREDQLKRDEAMQLKAMEDKNKQDKEKEQKEKEEKARQAVITVQVLKNQLENKKTIYENKKKEDKEYAQKIRNNVLMPYNKYID